MIKEIDIYEDMKERYPIVKSTGLSEDYLNELGPKIPSIQLLNSFPSSKSEREELVDIIIRNLSHYEVYYKEQYKDNPNDARMFIYFAKPEFLKQINKAVDQYNTFSKSTLLIERFQRIFLDYFRSIIRGEKFGVIKP